jgi:ankyrin repeat protein
MEVIRLPEVSLVDATGKRIGVYTHNPDWWHQLHQKKHSTMSEYSQMQDGHGQYNLKSSSVSLRDKLISRTEEDKTFAVKRKSVFNDMVVKQANDETEVSESKECHLIGETPLHLAIVYNDLEMVKFLIEQKGFDVNERNVGGQFIDGFMAKYKNLINNSNYESLAYYGEYPLAFAACFADKEMYDYLIDKGADPNKQGL